MIDAIAHRGPDAGGDWLDPGAGVALGHRRLSILDLSIAGAQPMESHCGRFVATYNGEIFNFAEIRRAIESERSNSVWRGHSDTEIALEAVVQWGFEKAFGRFEGMFAFAIWDRRERRLVLARDRLGKKPLFFGASGDRIAFASEMAAMRTLPGWRFEVDQPAVAAYLRHGYVPGDSCVFRGVYKVPPGSWIVLTRENASSASPSMCTRYWRAESLIQLNRGASQGDRGDCSAAIDQLDSVLSQAVADRTVADVPVGAFLSGGIDSSLIVAMATRSGAIPVQTFTVGLSDENKSEAPHAERVAKLLGTNHRTLTVTPDEILRHVPIVAGVYDEPFADASAVPTYLVSKLASQYVKVVLAGDGADELFGGYERYRQNAALWNLRSLPGMSAGSSLIRRFLARSRSLVSEGRTSALLGALSMSDPVSFYRLRVSHVLHPSSLLDSPAASESFTEFDRLRSMLDTLGIERTMMFVDLVTYLADDILVKTDRASMAHGLEVRSPFLDERVVDFSWGLHDAQITGRNQSKRLVRELLYRYVPRQLVDRPKTGFGFPLESWLLGPLRSWARDLVTRAQFTQDIRIRPGAVDEIWSEFECGSHRLSGTIWNLVMLAEWHQRWSSISAEKPL